MTEKTGRHPVELVAEVKSMELNLDYSGAYKLQLKDGSSVLADFTAEQWSILQSKHKQGRFPLNIVGEGEFSRRAIAAHRQHRHAENRSGDAAGRSRYAHAVAQDRPNQPVHGLVQRAH